MADWAETYLVYVRPTLVWVGPLGFLCILVAMRRQWWAHWKHTGGDDRFLGFNGETLPLFAPLVIWLLVFGFGAVALDMIFGVD